MALTSQQMQKADELKSTLNPVLKPLLASDRTGQVIGEIWIKHNIQSDADQDILAEAIFLYTLGMIDNQEFVSRIATISVVSKDNQALKSLLHDISQDLFGPYRLAFGQAGKDIDSFENLKPLPMPTKPTSPIPPARTMPQATPIAPTQTATAEQKKPVVTIPITPRPAETPIPQAPKQPSMPPTPPLSPKPSALKPVSGPQAILEEEKEQLKPKNVSVPIVSFPADLKKPEEKPIPKITYPSAPLGTSPSGPSLAERPLPPERPKEEKTITRFTIEPEIKTKLEISGSILSPGKPLGQKSSPISMKPFMASPTSAEPSGHIIAPENKTSLQTPPSVPPAKPSEPKISPTPPASPTPPTASESKPAVPPVITPEPPTYRPARPAIDLSTFEVKNKPGGTGAPGKPTPDILSERHEPLPTPPIPKAQGNTLDLGSRE